MVVSNLTPLILFYLFFISIIMLHLVILWKKT